MNKQRISSIMMVVFALLFLLSAGMLLAYYGEGMRQQQAFRELERITEQADDWGGEKSETAAVQTELSAEEKAAREYNALQEKNPDFWGWIKIDGTALSYPVMHTPENPEYYLRRDFEGAYSQRGVPFLDGRCYDGCGNYIIYGHYNLFEAQMQLLPRTGDYTVVLDSDMQPRCITRTTKVDVVPFEDVTADCAAAEGDGTLAAWKKAHRKAFAAACEEIGIDFDERMKCVCEYFDVVYRADGQ